MPNAKFMPGMAEQQAYNESQVISRQKVRKQERKKVTCARISGCCGGAAKIQLIQGGDKAAGPLHQISNKKKRGGGGANDAPAHCMQNQMYLKVPWAYQLELGSQ